jgi:hypothetical protein
VVAADTIGNRVLTAGEKVRNQNPAIAGGTVLEQDLRALPVVDPAQQRGVREFAVDPAGCERLIVSRLERSTMLDHLLASRRDVSPLNKPAGSIIDT